MARTSPANALPNRTGAIALAALAVIALLWAGLTLERWTTDDAFISFRYAANLVEGNGLVFNAGERVEAYSNFAWTLWAAVGLALGASAETWTFVWGAAAYLGAIALLAWNHHRLTRALGITTWTLPLAALGAALHRDWSLFSTSGLETGAFTLLLLAGALLVAWRGEDTRSLVAAGAVLGLAALTRPEGVLPAFVIGVVVLARSRRRVAAGLAFGVGFVALWLPCTVFRVAYYGDFFPNTYYAKSANLAWYVQGWRYTTLYFERYWPLLAGPLLLVVQPLLARLAPTDGDDDAPDGARVVTLTWLAAAVAAAHTFYVIRVGGDFMFARFLVPSAPFWLLLLEIGWLRAFRGRPVHGALMALVLLAGIAFTPRPVSGTEVRNGVVDEHAYYSAERVALLDRKAALLGEIFAGLPVRVAFYGDEARVVYKAGFPVAIESHAGLTEPAVARQPLTKRGRPGHEKHPSAEYLIEERHADITFSGVPQRLLRLVELIPEIIVRFDDTFTGQLLRWNPEIVERLRERGVEVPPFERMLDGYIANMGRLPDARVAADYERFRRFYFDQVADPAREGAFVRRLGLAGP